MLECLQFLTVVYALLATILPATLAVYFWSWGKGLGYAVSFMLIGESISSGVAFYFALNSYMNIWNSMSPWVAMGLRFVIFTVTVFSTIHMGHYLVKKARGYRV